MQVTRLASGAELDQQIMSVLGGNVDRDELHQVPVEIRFRGIIWDSGNDVVSNGPENEQNSAWKHAKK